jgi:alkanesulfonate monooxygenase SsuD/methylene tetrahydromethanopterin reductase-like flavin-dependent oxidoreductase (luciferase family)
VIVVLHGNFARYFASLDHISRGRVGWNVVTSGMNEEAMNFGRDASLSSRLTRDNATRYERAAEFLEAAKAPTRTSIFRW